MKVKARTPIKISKELLIQSKRNVFFKIMRQSLVLSKKLKKIVIIGIDTINGTISELKYQKFILLIIIIKSLVKAALFYGDNVSLHFKPKTIDVNLFFIKHCRDNIFNFL